MARFRSVHLILDYYDDASTVVGWCAFVSLTDANGLNCLEPDHPHPNSRSHLRNYLHTYLNLFSRLD